MTSNADYHADPAISASHLHAVAASPYHYWSRFINPDRPPSVQTAAMKLGSLTHCAVLEPDELASRYGIAPDRRTNAGKAAVAAMEAAGIEAVTAPEMEQAMAMAPASAAIKLLQHCCVTVRLSRASGLMILLLVCGANAARTGTPAAPSWTLRPRLMQVRKDLPSRLRNGGITSSSRITLPAPLPSGLCLLQWKSPTRMPLVCTS